MAENCHLLRRTKGALGLKGRQLFVLFLGVFFVLFFFLISVTLMDTPRRDTYSFEVKMDSPCIKQTVCKVLNKYQHRKYFLVYHLSRKRATYSRALCTRARK